MNRQNGLYAGLKDRPVVIEVTLDELPRKAIVDSWSKSATAAMCRGAPVDVQPRRRVAQELVILPRG